MLSIGDPAPWFVARSTVNSAFNFDTAAGRYVILCFFGSAASPHSRRVLDDIEKHADRFDVQNACFFGVSIDPDDERLKRVRQQRPGIMHFWDFDRSISKLYGVITPDGSQLHPHTLIFDLGLRTIGVMPFGNSVETHVDKLVQFLGAQPPIESIAAFAPIIHVPSVFEAPLCRTLIKWYEEHGGKESGFMNEIGGKTVGVIEHSFKRRADCDVTDPGLIQAVQARIVARIVPEIKKAYQFSATRIERHIVACYDAAQQGRYRAHRDNTTKGTAHRRFAVTLNLNTEEYEGGDLHFPEFGPRCYRAPTGCAIVFSCSMLHEAMPVTKGMRYAFLPFLYDEEAAKIRELNQQFVAEKVETPAS